MRTVSNFTFLDNANSSLSSWYFKYFSSYSQYSSFDKKAALTNLICLNEMVMLGFFGLCFRYVILIAWIIMSASVSFVMSLVCNSSVSSKVICFSFKYVRFAGYFAILFNIRLSILQM